MSGAEPKPPSKPTLARRILPLGAQLLTSPTTRSVRRAVAEIRRRVRGEPHRVLYFHQVDDPYSQLAVQCITKLTGRYAIELVPKLAGPPPDAAAPERAKLEAFARKDAADIAAGYGLAFSAGTGAPDASLKALAEQVLAHAISTGAFADVAPDVGTALWAGDRAALESLARQHRADDATAAAAEIERGTQLREQLGHYLGAMFYYGGEWYWGVDRLHHLERRLRSLGVARSGGTGPFLAPRPNFAGASAVSPPGRASERFTLEFFLSLRSPYTYIAMERVYALPKRYPVEIKLRPVLPMVMRGLPVPAVKRMYITLDTKREAEDAGVPFGRVCDPVGRPVERGFSLYPLACKRGVAAEYLLSFARAAFAEGIDTGTDEGIRLVAERVGIPWSEASQVLDQPGWRDELEANRAALFGFGLWGVPSFRLLASHGRPEFCTWGQDRIWRVEAEMRERMGGSA